MNVKDRVNAILPTKQQYETESVAKVKESVNKGRSSSKIT